MPARTRGSELSSLFVVATPIGNLGDLSKRATAILSSVEVIACEDTRRTGILMQHIGVKGARYIVVNDHTEFDAALEIVKELNEGREVALVSDAGTPAISDPGVLVVRAVIDAGHQIVSVPGASAAVTALSASGLDTRRYFFEGFLPRDGKDRSERLSAIKFNQCTTVIYEAPHRILRTIEDMHNSIGPSRRVVLARELTKMHEEYWRGTLGEAIEHLNSTEPIGEYVIIIDAAPPRAEATQEVVDEALRNSLLNGVSVKDAAHEVAEMFGLPKRDLYERALRIRKSDLEDH